MNPEIGDIFDCRKTPSLEHFILILGTRSKKGKQEVMYYIITSRVYTVFTDILDFFNDCITCGYQRFFRKFPKEKDKTIITPHGRLCDAFFFDKKTYYNACLDMDSMIVINKEPELIDRNTLEQLHKNKMAVYRDRIPVSEAIRLIEIIKTSNNVGTDSRNQICANYNVYKRANHL